MQSASNMKTQQNWPGWPGYSVFRLIVPMLKVGSIIGRKGDVIKKMCQDTKALIRVLDAPVGHPHRIVLISAKEEPELPLSPAMDAVMRVFKRINGFSGNESEGLACSVRLLVPSMQALSLIGNQGSSIKAIEDVTGCSVRVLACDEVSALSPNLDERIVDVKGEDIMVLNALEAVLGHLRKFLVDRSVLPLFEINIAKAIQIPLVYADDIIGVGGSNSGAILAVPESRGLPDEITFEIKGTAASEVQAAQHLIQEHINGAGNKTLESSTRCMSTFLKKTDSSKNDDCYAVPTEANDCKDITFLSDEAITPLNPPSAAEIPQEHISEAGNEDLCEKSPVTQCLTLTDMENSRNKKTNRANVRSNSKTKGLGISTSSRRNKGLEGRPSIVSLESFGAKKTRYGRVVLPPLQFWRNQQVVYDEDGQICGVQEPY